MDEEIDYSEEDSKEDSEKVLEEDSKEESIKNPIEEFQEGSEENPKEVEESLEEPGGLMERLIKNHKKVLKGIIICLCTFCIIYFGMARYFTNRFYFGTEINGISVSGKTVEDVKEILGSELREYTLNLKKRGGKTEQIKGNDLNLKYDNLDKKIQKQKESQNPYRWISACFTKGNTKTRVELLYDEKLLEEKVRNLSCLDKNNMIEPKNPDFQYVNHGYVIIGEVQGNKINKEILYSKVAEAISNGEREMDLEAKGCYAKPKYHAKSQKAIEVKEILNQYVSSEITYIFGEDKEIIDGSIINKWLIVNENFEVIIDEEKVKDYINELSQTYNTVGKTRNFVTSSGTTIKVGGGDYGWAIHSEKETESLMAAIKEGKAVTKKPEYSQRAFSHGSNDIGNTYVEIDLTNQHMWFYKNGSLITHGDIVTGNVSKNHTTPKGIYRLKFKVKDAVLRGPGYASPVDFWMPFNGGIGIHDASWRNTFGGNIYKTNGSHGCINSPYNVAETIFNNIEPETPVVCY